MPGEMPFYTIRALKPGGGREAIVAKWGAGWGDEAGGKFVGMRAASKPQNPRRMRAALSSSSLALTPNARFVYTLVAQQDAKQKEMEDINDELQQVRYLCVCAAAHAWLTLKPPSFPSFPPLGRASPKYASPNITAHTSTPPALP